MLNKNAIPFDPAPPSVASGIRVGTPCVTTQGMGEEEMYEMFRLLAIAKYNERYVIPTAHAEQAHRLEEIGTDCAVSAYDHSGDAEPFGVGSGPEVRIAVEDLRIRTARMKDDA